MEGLVQLEQEIERKRMELNQCYNLYGLSSEQVLKKSQELDKLLNCYQRGRKK